MLLKLGISKRQVESLRVGLALLESEKYISLAYLNGLTKDLCIGFIIFVARSVDEVLNLDNFGVWQEPDVLISVERELQVIAVVPQHPALGLQNRFELSLLQPLRGLHDHRKVFLGATLIILRST